MRSRSGNNQTVPRSLRRTCDCVQDEIFATTKKENRALLPTALVSSMTSRAKESQDPPSRTPTPPLATAPGPRASALQKLYADAIAHILYSGCSYANFSACFPTPASKVPESLKLLHEQFTAKLGEGMRREFEAIVEEREVVRGLNGLDGLVEDARRRKGRGEGKQAPVSYVLWTCQACDVGY